MENVITLFEGFINPVAHLTLNEILQSIKDGKYKNQIDAIRQFALKGDYEQASSLKRRLPGFTASGQFVDGRRAELLTHYSGYIILDLDNLNEQLEATFQNVVKQPYTMGCFRSPSGNGLKIIVSVSTGSDWHE